MPARTAAPPAAPAVLAPAVLALLGAAACSHAGARAGSLSSGALSYGAAYALADRAGSFVVERRSGPGGPGAPGAADGERALVTKERVLPPGGDGDGDGFLERTVAVAAAGTGGPGDVPLLVPRFSQHTVWLEGGRHFVETRFAPDGRTMDARLASPEARWSGRRSFPVPEGAGALCYVLQVVECAGYAGFVREAVRRGVGRMRLTLVWEGWPYVREQYQGLPEGPFGQAVLSYDGPAPDGGRRFSLDVGGQSILYVVDGDGKMTKRFWISQGSTLLIRDP